MRKLMQILTALCFIGILSGCENDSEKTTDKPLEMTMDALLTMMQESPNTLSANLQKYKQGAGTNILNLQTDRYSILLNKEEATLEISSFPEKVLSMTITKATEENQLNNFTSLKALVDSKTECTFKSAIIGTFNEQGNVDKSNIITEKGKAEAEMKKPNMAVGFYKFGYTYENLAISAELNKGQASLVIRTTCFPDEWRWYTSFFGQDMTSVINEYYFSIKSVGFIPPMSQIFILNGLDDANKELNIVFFAEGHNPISRVEATYQIKDPAEARLYWLEKMKSPEVENEYGKFESTIIFPKNKDEQPLELKTLKETIEWVENNDIASVDYVIPIFRTPEDKVISPQIDVRGFALTITSMDKKPENSKRIF